MVTEMGRVIEISVCRVGQGEPCFIIAEAGVNHNGSQDIAEHMILEAKEAQCDAVKFQAFTASNLVIQNAPKAPYQLMGTDPNESQFDMLKSLELDKNTHESLMEHALSQGIVFLSSPFDESCADFLESIGIAAFKVPSGEVTNLPFLRHVAQKGKPIILSTGMATLGEVEHAIEVISGEGNEDLILLHCGSNYPLDPVDANLRAMETLRRAFGYAVGYSDHTLGIEVALAAVSLGACVIEKHFTLDRTLQGPDHQASIEPEELKRLVIGIRKVEAALGNGRKVPANSELPTSDVARKSLVAAYDLPAGAILTEEMIAIKRPGTGLKPKIVPLIIGRKLRKNIPGGTILGLEMFQ
jgi:N,N'-diacetyllegionaminate synthase